jgi:hypothetical protein
LLISGNALASWSQLGKITQTYTHADWTMVTISGDQVNPDNCESNAYYAINTSEKNYEGILSSILSAQMSGKEIRFWLTGCSVQGGKYPKIISIVIKT